MQKNIPKLCVQSFLAGFVLWYGIEKLFMSEIGISAVGIGVAVLALQACTVVLDIPTGILADLWSRKGVLAVSAVALIASCLVMAVSQSLPLYIVGVGLYALHVVTAATTTDAMVYDSLLEMGRPDAYSKIGGLVGSLSLIGYATASFAGGFLAQWLESYRLVYVLAVVPSVINLALVAWLQEPRVHRSETLRASCSRAIKDIFVGSRAIAAVGMLRALIAVMCLLWIVEAFKEGFGQLYFLPYAASLPDGVATYVSRAAVVGTLWAVFYLIWAFGEYCASMFDAHLSTLIVLSVLPLLAMCFLDNWFGVALFMVQAFLAGALFVQIQARIHDATPSTIRASVLSVRTFAGRLTTIVVLPLIGLVFDTHGGVWAVRCVSVFGVAALVVWFGYHALTRYRRTEVVS